MKAVFFSSLFFICASLHAQIPASRTIDWSTAGVQGGIPNFTASVNFLNNGGVANNTSFDNSVPLQTLVNSKAGTNTVIYFPAGTYRFKQKISIPAAGRIIFRGAGADSTKFEFETGAINTGNFEIWGSTGATYNVVSGATKNSTQLTLSGTSGLAVNDWLDLAQDNDSVLMDTNNPPEALVTGPRSVGQVVKITAISGNTVTLDRPLHYTYNMSLNVQVTECNMARRIGFENFTIRSLNSGAKHHFLLVYAVNCWIKCVSSIKSDITHVNPSFCANLTIRDSHFNDAWEFGGGGHGGGVCLSMHTTDCLIENNIFDKLRHAMLVQRGANGNVFGYNFSINGTSNGTVSPLTRLPDGSLHGHFPYMNLYEGNVMQEIHSADHWGPSGQGNTFFRNRICREGIRISDRSIDQNVVGNDLRKDASAAFTQNVISNESGVVNTLLHGNKEGSTVSWDPNLGSNNLVQSYYLTSAPAFFNGAPWPCLGPEAAYASGTIPAETRYGQSFNTECENGLFTSIAENENESFRVYPNPASDLIQIAYAEKEGRMRLVNSFGQTVLESTLTDRLDIHNCPQGIYNLILSSGHRDIEVKKIVIIR